VTGKALLASAKFGGYSPFFSSSPVTGPHEPLVAPFWAALSAPPSVVWSSSVSLAGFLFFFLFFEGRQGRRPMQPPGGLVSPPGGAGITLPCSTRQAFPPQFSQPFFL